ncbi:BgTH12-00973 [Blumeria graminis f. sp. triticale]|uniref:Bgt-1915 n=3 Tax=Blumeria graminis TaxID=34373 RepID=A0A061HHV7_BLUGR|nr:Fatty acid desaturase [Blumeria graminis f. sp. tritici 96224]CAD6505482.1 BgTH12-00973 [Blumeria graminis f. sp. triticale]VDB93623.1 Bgt-1915 [Blumeria graminis f. sp. tritici]
MEDKPQHIDLNGNSFELPSFTMKEIYDAIPAHCFKPSTIRSMAYVARDYLYLSTLIYLSITYIPLIPSAPLRFVAWTAYTVIQGFVFTGIWILAHECGHGAFSKSKTLNWTMGLIMHSFLLVPFHSWRLSHSQHHKATGNIERDTAFVPHTRDTWLKTKLGPKASANMIEFAELAEDSPIVALWHDLVHQLVGWPGYLLFNLTGQKYGGAKGLRISHFYFGEDSVFFKKNELGLILLSDIGVAVMVVALVIAGQTFGSWNICILFGVPWLWVNNWIVAITFLQHTDASMPHYSNSTWTFARGATATIDRDLGFLDTHFFHDIIGTHVCHHLISSIPFYHAGEASTHIKRVMGSHYKSDTKTPFWTAFWRNQRSCKFVEESEGCEGSGVYMFRNLYKREGEVRPLQLVSNKGQERAEYKEEKKPLMATSRNLDTRRRLSQSAQLRANLPLLADG